MRTPRKGMEVKIQFRDHRRNDDTPISYVVYGRIHQGTEEAITLDCWVRLDDAPAVSRDVGNDVECFCILRKVIEKICVAMDWRCL